MKKAYKFRLYPNEEQKNILLNILDVLDLSTIKC